MKLNETFKQFVLYVLVGGIATIVEWVCFYQFSNIWNIHYMLATTLAFIFSTFANWAAGRLIMFKGDGNILFEIMKIYAASIIGIF